MSEPRPREFAFERAFRRWLEARGGRWQRLRYARPEAGGEVSAYRLAPPGPPRARVLLVHGAGNDALFALVGLCKALLRRGCEVASFDVDGHGRHSGTRLRAEAAPGAVPAALRQAWPDADSDALPLHGVGVSLGGALLLRALADLPGAFVSATLQVAPLRVEFSPRALRAELGRPLLRAWWRERAHYGLTGLIPSFGPVRRGAYPLRLEAPRPGAFGYVAALNELLESLRLEDAARAVRAPTLLVYGAADRLVPAAQGERLARLLPHAELLVLAGETHLSTPLAPLALARTLRQVTPR